jgi:hypothetical protein
VRAVHQTRRPVVQHEREQFWPGVVTDRIHHPLALGDQREVKIGDKDSLAAGKRWYEVIALRRHDRSHAAAAQALAQTFLGRDLGDLFFGQPAGGIDDEAPTFERVMSDRHLDLVGEDLPDQRSRKLGGVDFLMLRHQRIAGEGVVVLPAGQCTDATDRRLHDLQARAVPLAPNHALVERRCDLAPLEQERAIRIEHELGIVERAVIALVDAEHHDHAMTPGRLRDGLGDGTGHDDGVVVELNVLGPAQDRRTDKGEIRVPGNERLWKNGKLDAFAGCLGDRCQDPIDRSSR